MSSGLEQDVSELSLFNDSLRAFLECPVCYDFCMTPIYMCNNGHHTCNKCQPSLTQCPSCRVNGRPSARSLPLEKIADQVRTPCANKREGCEAVLNAEGMAQHWRTCKEKYMYECCVNITPEVYRLCEWIGDWKTLVAHLKEDHPGIYSQDDVIKCHVAINFTMTKDTRYRRLVSAHGELFWVMFWFISHLNTARIYSLYFGKKENAANYKGKFVYSSNDGCIVTSNVVDSKCVHDTFESYPTKISTISKPTLNDCMSGGKFTFTAQILKK